jgi:hypothetical protein
MANAPRDAASGGEDQRRRPLNHGSLGEEKMRSNSGNRQARNNMCDPTIRDRTEQRTKRSHRSHISHSKAPADHRGGRKD